jgi:hypothetical protein
MWTRSALDGQIPRRVRAWAFALLCAATALAAGCPADEPEGPTAIKGAAENSERYVVYLKGEGPDLTEYRKALSDEPDKVPEIVAALREDAERRHKKFEKALRALSGTIVDHWYLTNAVTVEIPKESAPTLKITDGVLRVEPDTILAP